MPPRLESVPTIRDIRIDGLQELDPDFKEYTPDQGMPDIVWHLNEAQIDYLLQKTWNTALESVKEGVPPILNEGGYWKEYEHGHNGCRTAVTDHINSLGV